LLNEGENTFFCEIITSQVVGDDEIIPNFYWLIYTTAPHFFGDKKTTNLCVKFKMTSIRVKINRFLH
jgi:hypothetical protein